ncbi:MAG: MoaD/ThiS family protein [Planctomycetes bacterium]|nr:MoaD/ThiS family protein [Planctomycetota bacterium]MBI3835761.1 MoaD/ThiS family protein [Planctomycetota bacterium]
MVRVTFTRNLQRYVASPAETLKAGTVREALDAAFAMNERARGYVLDDRGALRKHMIVFVNGQAIKDRDAQSDPVPDGAEIYVMQALSGG